MISTDKALSSLPVGLRKPLIEEYSNIVQHYLRRKWTSSELSGGKFCEIVYTILKGYSDGNYPLKPEKPTNFVSACRTLETNVSVPRSFQILIPRMLPALYEIRNNRGVGHVGGDVDPNHMDANTVLAMTSWILAELIREFHTLTIEEAQRITDSLVERKTPLVWQSGDIKRVSNTDLSLREETLVLLASSSGSVTILDLIRWIEPSNKSYYKQILLTMHKSRELELSTEGDHVQILPKGMEFAEKIIARIL
jgi:hypothetical protein